MPTSDAQMGSMAHLEELWLDDNHLAAFPAVRAAGGGWRWPPFHSETPPQCLLAVPTLRVLRLSNNALTSLPEGISALSALTELAVDNNALTAVPASLCSLPALRKLLLQ